MAQNRKRTKIVATLGPAISSESILEEMMEAGVNVFRVNFSHADYDEVAEKINAIVEKRRAEGAKEKDVSFSSVASMLLELGLRVYEAQMERKEIRLGQNSFIPKLQKANWHENKEKDNSYMPSSIWDIR